MRWSAGTAKVRVGFLAVSALVCAAAWAQDDGIDLGGGVLLDAGYRQLIVPDPEGGVVALALSDGARRWAFSGAERPVLVEKDLCLLQGEPRGLGELRLATLKTNDGKPIGQAVSALPASVRADVAPTRSSRFSLRPLRAAGRTRLAWTFDPASHDAPRPLSQRGVLTLHLPTARAAALDVPLPAPAPSPRTDVSWADENERSFFSADRQHVLNSLREIRDGRTTYRWRIYDLDQRRLATVTEDRPYAPFAVHRDTLVIADGRRLSGAGGREVRVRSLTDGRLIWRASIRDLMTPTEP
ncbi:MAG: hypothetical protein AAFU65_07830 [Pseudomonadota bacterium]